MPYRNEGMSELHAQIFFAQLGDFALEQTADGIRK
jgi:hypothetical protein